MAWPHRNLKQTITYWAPGAPDGFGGKAYNAPTNIKGRWEDRVQNIMDNSGQETVSNATVYLSSDVAVHGYLFNGNSTASSPVGLSGAYEIKRVDKTPTLNAQYFERKVLL